MNPCQNCDTPTDHPWEVCPKCFRDPDTNNCEKCGKHLSGIPYPYVCGTCLKKPKNVVWVVEREGVMESVNTERLRDALAMCKVPTVSVDPLYFTDDLPEVDGELPEGAVLVYYGSTTLRDKLVAAGRPGVFFDPVRFSFQALRDGYGEELLNHGSVVVTVGEFLAATQDDPDELLFIRPTEDSKTLTGGVHTRREWVDAIQISMNNTHGPKFETPIQLGEPRNIEYEWRLFMVDGRVVASSRYRAYGYPNRSEEVPDRVVQYAEDMATKYQPAKVFVMDVCELSVDGSLRVIETNCASCSGFYAADVREIVRGITQYVGRHPESLRGHLRGDMPR